MLNIAFFLPLTPSPAENQLLKQPPIKNSENLACQ
jgi:hypothetical protein